MCTQKLSDEVKKKIKQKMETELINDSVIDIFLQFLESVKNGNLGLITEKEIEPLPKGMLRSKNDISTKINKKTGLQLLKNVVIIKLNGGLGTGMGLNKAKSLIEVKSGLNYLDIIVKQIKTLREKSNEKIPILFMNSFATSKDTVKFLDEKYKDLRIKGLSIEMVQNKYPKINQETFLPADNPDEDLNWNPPGHGDIYSTLYTTGVLDELLASNIKYAFISNADNLGAVFSESIVGFMENENIPFIMETAKRTESDKKGGHLSKQKGKATLKLRERANCPEEEIESFENIDKWSDFNTNSLWLNLEALKTKLDENDGKMPLDLIVNQKRNNPQIKEEEGRPEDNVEIFQLETAMGSAVSYFENAHAIRIDSTKRFFPTKKISDLMILRSDAIKIKDNGTIELNERKSKPVVKLDETLYKTINDLELLCQELPSLKDCDRLEIKGPGRIIFAGKVVIKGSVYIENKEIENYKIENTTLENCRIINK
ncbi:UTP-glucose-1-phosphate uridylyltransferase [Candidatus Magnetomorum sp. HK-1]|nr:UTP-glucose-1-phosphate uridylyltransferase [Candidatus Magnetomorum sp. HK-1]